MKKSKFAEQQIAWRWGPHKHDPGVRYSDEHQASIDSAKLAARGAVGLFCSDLLRNRVPPSFIPQWAQMEAVDGQAAVDRRLSV